MLLPNKVISIQESCVYKASILMASFTKTTSLLDLYQLNKNKFIDISEFIETINLLFITEKINVDLEKGTIKKC